MKTEKNLKSKELKRMFCYQKQYQKKKVRLVENIQEGEKEEKEEKENLAKHEKNVEENLEDDGVDICL